MSGRPAPAPLAWALLLGRTLAAVVVAVTCGLAIWSVLPRAAGWSPSVVMTGSMQPRLHPGDVVLSAPASARTVTPGQIILVTDPAMPSHLLVHRFMRFTPSGDLITKGDANRREDSSPVPPASVRGLPRLRLPYIGLGIVWLHDHSWRQLGLAALAILAACGLLGSAGPGLDDRSGETQDDDPAPVDREPQPVPVRRLPERDPATGRFIPARAGR
ncbi:MAG: signal peptidase [Frankiales bacterium]|jgi:signal peptidase|nr:signal peptidase [Frankiales bacterium]MDX6207961.1 signal peptidase [Frankiales bacterium]